MISRAWIVVAGATLAGNCFAASIAIPGGSLTVPGTSTSGTSFTYSGTLTQADTIALSQAGTPCLQSAGTSYCTNGAGVLTVAGTTPVGGSSTFAGPSGVIPAGTWTYGSLLMIVSGVGAVQVFPTNAGNGLGSSAPPASLTRAATTLGALGFPNFSQVNPTITFIVADTGFADNGGQFTLTQAAPTPPTSTAPIPTLSGWAFALLVSMLAIAAGTVWRQRQGRP
jgi:hypothetical protein